MIHGDKRGRELGFPTANLRLDPACGLKHGIYAVRVGVGGARYDGVASFGRGRCSTTARRCWKCSCSISPAISTGRRSTSPSSAGSGHEQKFASDRGAQAPHAGRLRAGARRAQARRQGAFRRWGRFSSPSSRASAARPGIHTPQPTDRLRRMGPRLRGDDAAFPMPNPPATQPRHVEAAKRDYSETLFLPQTDFPMRAGLPQTRAGDAQALGAGRSLRAAARGRQGPRQIHPARRPALRQRQHPHRHTRSTRSSRTW